MTGLPEEPLKEGNAAAHPQPRFFQHRQDRHTRRWLAFAERYAEGEVCLHAHMRVLAKEFEPAYYCAIFERSQAGIDDLYLGTVGSPRASLKGGADEMKAAVLVDHIKGVDDPQVIGVLPSTVRLQPLRRCQHLFTDTRKLLVVSLIPVGSILEDWKLGELRTRSIQSDQFVRGVLVSGLDNTNPAPRAARPNIALTPLRSSSQCVKATLETLNICVKSRKCKLCHR